MDTNKIAIFNKLISTHNQYQISSELWKTIKFVFGCSDKVAKKRAKFYCNIISLWAACFADGLIDVSLSEFVAYGMTTGDMRQDGFIKASKKKLLNRYGVDISMTDYDDYNEIMKPYNLDTGYFYQVKIKSRGRGFHFMSCFLEDGVLKVSDSSSRGIGVDFKDVVNKKSFMWLLKIG